MVERRIDELQRPVKVMSPETFGESWGRAWEGYLKARREKGLDDPRRLPPPEFMSKRCDI